MGNLQYIGARYVPLVFKNPDDGTANWKSGITYEALTIVTFNGDSYTSRQAVPDGIGNPASNPDYWTLTGNFNASLNALQNRVSNIEQEIDTDNLVIPLEAYGLIEAINTNYLNSKFAAKRYGSMLIQSAQSVVYDNGNFYIAGDVGGASFFINVVDASTMTISATHTYNYSCHPNSMFKLGDHLWIVDSNGHDIYKIAVADMTISDIISSIAGVPANSITGGSVWDDKIYLFDGNVYVLDENLDFIDEINLENPNVPGTYTQQAIFVYDGFIYRIFNNPNILAIYNMAGEFIATKDIGNGNDRYPYGEVETLFIMNDSIYMNTTYFANPSIGVTLLQIFETNLIRPVMRDGRDGYGVADGDIIYIDNTRTHHRNPDGSQSNPFETLYEGCLMFNYLESINNDYRRLRVIGDFSTETGIFTNCDVNIAGTLGEIRAYNSTVTFVFSSNVAKLIAEDSHITAFRTTFGEVDCSRCMLSFNGGEISTSISFRNCVVKDDYCLKEADAADVTFTDGFQECVINVKKGNQDFLTSAPIPLNGYTQAVVFGRYSGTYSSMKMMLNFANGKCAEVCAYLTVNRKNMINNGTGFTTTLSALIHDDSTPIIVNLNVTINKDSIVMNSLTGQHLDGTSASVSNILVYKVEFINDLVN